MFSDSEINTIRDKYRNGTTKVALAKEYEVPIKRIVNVVAGLKRKIKETNDFLRATEKKELVILMYLKGCKKVEIEKELRLSAYFVTMFINNFEKATTPTKDLSVNIAAVRSQEEKLIKLAEELAKGKGSETRYKIMLSVFAGLDPNSGAVINV